MVYKPRTTDQIYDSLRTGLINRISNLTNFVETSFNYVWTQAFSSRFKENEEALLAAQLSGWIDYAGGPITQEQLDSLEIEGVTPEEVNEYMEDSDLDKLVEIVGVDRDPGEQANGDVTFTTVSSYTEIPAGTEVATQPDGSGNYFSYTTDTDTSTASGDTETTVGITAVDVGEEFNVGSGQVTYLPSPPTGVQAVVNNQAILGGANQETNEELRERAKNAIFDKSGGGTAAGVRGYVSSNTEDVSTVAIAEYPGGNASLAANSPSPGGPGGASATAPFADVIVEGGDDQDILESINESRPVAIQHNLVRPELIEINVTASVLGSGIATDDIVSSVTTYINNRGLGEALYRDKIIQRALNADAQVENIETLTVEVTNESHTFQTGTDIYALDKGEQMVADGITSVTGTSGGASTTFVEGTDYEEVDSGSDGQVDAIDWSLGGANPDDGTDFFVQYTIDEDIPIDEYEKADANSVTVNVI